MKKSFIAHVDRVVDGKHAVLLLEEDGEIVEQHVVDIKKFDETQQIEGEFLEVVLDNGDIVDIKKRPDIKQNRRERISKKREKLRERSDGSENNDG